MKNFKIEHLVDKDPLLYNRLKQWCYELNGCCQEVHYVKDKAFIECKAVEKLCADHRQQLWNYMRLTKTRIGILWNFAPVRDQSEHYYLDVETDTMFMF